MVIELKLSCLKKQQQQKPPTEQTWLVTLQFDLY